MRINPGKDIFSDFMKTFAEGVPELAEPPGEPVFTEEDVLATNDPLSRMLRIIFIKKGVSHQMFAKRHREHAQNVLGEVPSRISTSKGNMLSAIKRPCVSFKKFYEVVVDILGYDIDMTFTLTDANGVSDPIGYNQSINEVVNKVRDRSEEIRKYDESS